MSLALASRTGRGQFQTRHLNSIAAALVASRPDHSAWDTDMAQWHITVADIAAMLELDNPRFNRERFIAAVTDRRATSEVGVKTG